MTSYILLTLLIIIIALGVARAAKQPKMNRRKKTLSHEALFQQQATDNDPLTDNYAEDHGTVSYDTSETSLSEDEDVYEYEEDEEESETYSNTNSISHNEIITITLRADEGETYKGYELLQTLLTAGLRYSRQGVFHRYNKLIRRDEILFSLMSAVAPGTFDLPKMGGFSSPALTFFMEAGHVQNPIQTYNMMLATAKELSEVLGGKLLDERKQPLTAETVAAWQERLKELVAA